MLHHVEGLRDPATAAAAGPSIDRARVSQGDPLWSSRVTSRGRTAAAATRPQVDDELDEDQHALQGDPPG